MPSTPEQLLAWHSQALANRALKLDIDMTEEPHCGWYRRRLTKGAVFVPARIFVEQDIDPETGDLVSDETICCEVNGRREDPEEQWNWIGNDPITQEEFDYLTARGEWSRDYAPNEPAANPRKRVDWNRVPIPTFTKGDSA